MGDDSPIVILSRIFTDLYALGPERIGAATLFPTSKVEANAKPLGS